MNWPHPWRARRRRHLATSAGGHDNLGSLVTDAEYAAFITLWNATFTAAEESRIDARLGRERY